MPEKRRAHTDERFAALVKEKKIYAIKVAQGHTTFDGVVSQKTVIETYVPILAQGQDETGRVVSQPGKGATFTILLPAAPPSIA